MTIQVRDPVHNFISLSDKERDLVASQALQRLRGIRQLAFASLVYPGALHTRFDHTLGVMHVAGQMAEAVLDHRHQNDQIELVRLAALLHDIGHGPFSHVSEYALERYGDRTTLKPDQKKEKIHELVTAIMIRTNPEILHILGAKTCEKVALLLATGYGERVLRQIVSGPLDADKQDYLLRDSYFCGVQYGVFDHHQLHRSLTSVLDNHDHVLMIRADGVHAVEQYVLAKYYLTSNVYRHKVRLVSDQMIVRAITLGIEKDNIAELRTLYSFDNTPEFVKRYAEWDDSRFMQQFGVQGSPGKCREILRRLMERRLLKRVFTGRPAEFKEEVREQLLELVKPGHDEKTRQVRISRKSRVESVIADILQAKTGRAIDPDLVVYHAFDIKSVKEMSKNDEASILVNKHPQPVPFEQASTLFNSINSGLNDEFIEVYAPMEWQQHPDREKLCGELRSDIISAVEKELSPPTEGANK